MSDSKTRPLIGLTSYYQRAQTGVWDTKAALLPEDYVREVAAAGGSPVLLPPVGTETAIVQQLDGIIISGGSDLNPARYGQDQHPTTEYDEARDAHDTAILLKALELGKPVLAICRGMQVLNVALGGTLHQHLPDVIGHEQYRPGPGIYGQVEVSVAPGSILHSIVGEHTSAPCYHHQAIKDVAPHLVSTGTNPEGLCEALELTPESGYTGWMLAVQWHPEHNRQDRRIIDEFIAQAAKRPTRKNQA